MSWCDKLASVPGVGFRLNPHFAPSDLLLSAMTKILDPLFDGNKVEFRIGQQQPFDVQFSTDEGFYYSIDPIKASVQFVHRMRARPASGSLPVMEMLSKPLPYTEFLPVVAHKAIEVTVLVSEQYKRTVDRLGIISSTTVALEDMPPGLGRFIEYVSRPWSGNLEEFNIAVTAEIADATAYRDRCIHTLKKSEEDQEGLVSISLDWQRIYTSGHPANRDALTKIVEDGQRAALRYFEDLGEGRRFDERLIREAAGV